MAADDDAWERAKRDYADHTVKLGAIAESVGLGNMALISRMRALGIVRGKADQETAKAKAKAGSKEHATHKPIALVQRVYNTINLELTKLEEQIGTSSQDRERASRALSQMVNSLEKAVDMQRDIVKDKSRGSGVKDKEALAHAEDLRRQIADRLEKLFVKRRPAKHADGAE